MQIKTYLNYQNHKLSIIKLIILFCALNGFFINQTIAQSTSKGATITNTLDTSKKGNTWAVIVGISKYQNVQGLNYADKDALAFYDYLVNKKGLDKDHIQLLINEKAIASDIYGALDWLNLSIKENDRVIFYFSGHGDVETKTIYQNGFLLANDAPVAAYMTKGTINITFLQQYLETYIAKKAKDVLLIVDACRSGKLAGGSEGIQITMHSLGQTWNNQIIKVLSAQEGEASFEDKKWGGGRGVFSYYLVKGLEDLANKNADSVITTAELAAYLPFAVADATGSVQNPTVSGNPRTSLFSFNKDLLALANSQENQSLTGQILAARGTMDELDPEIASWYNQYRTYLQKGRLIWGEKQTDTVNCAKHYYLKLVKDKRAKTLLPSLKSSFLGSLKHKMEVELDKYIKGNGFQDPNNEAYEEMIFAKSLIDTTYILNNYLTARGLFLEGIKTKDSLKAIKLFKNIIQIEPDASYAYNELGLNFDYKLHNADSAEYYYKKAIELSPTWSTTYNELAYFYNLRYDSKNAIHFAEIGVKLDTTNTMAFFNLAGAYSRLGNKKKSDSIINRFILINKALIKNDDRISPFRCLLVADASAGLGNYADAMKYLNEGIKLDPSALEIDPNFLVSETYSRLKDYDNAIKVELNVIKAHPNFANMYYNIAGNYSLKTETKKSLQYLEISIQKGFKDYKHINEDTDLTNIKQLPKFKELIKKYFPDKVK